MIMVLAGKGYLHSSLDISTITVLFVISLIYNSIKIVPVENGKYF